MAQRDLVRCPVCAKLSAPKLFAAAEGAPELEVMTCAFTGGGRAGRPRENRDGRDVLKRDADGKPLKGAGFAWSRRALAPDEAETLLTAAEAAATRLRLELGRTDDPLDELARLREQVKKKDEALRLAAEQLRLGALADQARDAEIKQLRRQLRSR